MTYPITLLSSWILASIVDSIEPQSVYVSDISKKRFIIYDGPNNCNINYTPLVRIFAFYPTNASGEVLAIVNDSTHKIPVVFTRNAIRTFETQYGQRLTFKSIHTLVILSRADFHFIDRKHYADFSTIVGKLLSRSTKHIPPTYLKVNEVFFFLRDAHMVQATEEGKLQMVYAALEYQKLFGPSDDSKNSASRNAFLRQDKESRISTENTWPDCHDDMVSEAEDDVESDITRLSQISDIT